MKTKEIEYWYGFGFYSDMFKSLIILALRNLQKDSWYSVLNILGLTIGITFSVFLIFYVKDELSYERHYKQADRIHRIVSYIQEPEKKMDWCSTQYPLGPTLLKDFPDVAHAVRFVAKERTLFKHGEVHHFETKIYYTDSSVFDVFDQVFVEGNPVQALREPNSAVITQSLATKYFGKNTAVLGKTLQTASNDLYKITGVIQDRPARSHILFDVLLSNHHLSDDSNGSWGGFNNFTYVLLKPTVDAYSFEQKLIPLYDKFMAPIFAQYNIKIKYGVQPITDIHLKSKFLGEPEEAGSMSYIYIFSAVAFFMLFIACINYMNLTTARSARRAKEIGIRKVTGSSQSLLVYQFLSEAVLTSVVAVLLSILLIIVLLPYFNIISGKQFSISTLFQPSNVFLLIAIAVFTGLISGSYPAFYLSGFQPVSILKGALSKASGNINLRQSLVVIQFSIAMIMLICTWVVYSQLRFIRTKDLGFDQEQVMTLIVNTGKDERSKIYAFTNELRALPSVKSVGTGYSYPGSSAMNLNLFQVESSTGYKEKGINTYQIDDAYIPTLGMDILKGRNFNGLADTLRSVLVNEAMVRDFGWGDQAIGKKIKYPGDTSNYYLEVIGVVKDFNQTSLYNPIAPLILGYSPNCNNIQVKLSNQNELSAAIKRIDQTWSRYFPELPFEYTFLDNNFNTQYAADQKRGKIFLAFSLLTLVITCLGLLGLTAFTTQQKQKEISMRRVLGATTSQVVALITKSYLWLALIAALIAFPVAWYFMHKWLRVFTFHEEMSVIPFIVSALFILLTALLTSGFHSAKAAWTKPAKILKSE